eukprot:CAMPEP_0184675946 /NCGR_PEP_ID=MMETSP0308-20130426/88087_1 /TAXON_ID=38269 /ORGANISM="Gloeochaete witrockiana, Strain SAG 46.84" /LENGTH=298 /DNA_ID=CAMNT_0027123741 /DNA_START=118 /DNA_END=1015 /DNA_ORIENTATION=-
MSTGPTSAFVLACFVTLEALLLSIVIIWRFRSQPSELLYRAFRVGLTRQHAGLVNGWFVVLFWAAANTTAFSGLLKQFFPYEDESRLVYQIILRSMLISYGALALSLVVATCWVVFHSHIAAQGSIFGLVIFVIYVALSAGLGFRWLIGIIGIPSLVFFAWASVIVFSSTKHWSHALGIVGSCCLVTAIPFQAMTKAIVSAEMDGIVLQLLCGAGYIFLSIPGYWYAGPAGLRYLFPVEISTKGDESSSESGEPWSHRTLMSMWPRKSSKIDSSREHDDNNHDVVGHVDHQNQTSSLG